MASIYLLAFYWWSGRGCPSLEAIEDLGIYGLTVGEQREGIIFKHEFLYTSKSLIPSNTIRRRT